MDWSSRLALPRPLVTICTASQASLGGISHAAGYTSAAWASANRALFIPFRSVSPFVAKKLFAYNGATASGNIDVGIYDHTGRRLVSAGSTAQAGTSALQVFDITDTLIGVGRFYLGIALDNTTGTLMRFGVSIQETQLLGVLHQATAFPLPATATFAAANNANVPLVGLTTSTVL